VRAALPCRLDATTAARVVLNPPPFLPEAPFERFPIGTTYVVEGRAGEHGKLLVSSRYVVLPGRAAHRYRDRLRQVRLRANWWGRPCRVCPSESDFGEGQSVQSVERAQVWRLAARLTTEKSGPPFAEIGVFAHPPPGSGRIGRAGGHRRAVSAFSAAIGPGSMPPHTEARRCPPHNELAAPREDERK
jgi:hypothetical protein